MGYSGFNDFRMKLNGRSSDGLPLVHPGASANDKVCDVVVKVVDGALAAINQFRVDVDAYAVGRAVGILSATFRSKKKVLLVGSGISGLVAQDALMKLCRLGVHAASHVDNVLQIIEASRLGTGDSVCAFSNSGRTRDVLEIVDLSKKRGASVIAVTSSRSPLAAVADVHLAANHSEGYGEFNPMVSRLLQLTVVDILATSLAIQVGGAEISSRLIDIEKNLSAKRLS
jgi:RpiR family carbohydrate utilization transcriptional regulator